MLLIESKNILENVQLELDQRGIATNEIRRLLAKIEGAIEAGEESQEAGSEPYFIPNDLSQCTALSVLNYSPVDRELELPTGYSIEASATKRNTFAKPYYIDPVKGIRRCKGLFALETYADRFAWDYDLSFVGHKGKRNANAAHELLADTSNTRSIFFRAFAEEFIPTSEASIHFRVNEHFFFSDSTVTPETREQLNRESKYIQSIRDSRFVLCPRGGATNSIRFFETLACCNIPVYVGNRETKLPLEWIIDWDQACFRISCEEVANRSYASRLRKILEMPLDEVNRRRRYIFHIYHQFLAPERERVFQQLVLLRVREDIICMRGPLDGLTGVERPTGGQR